MIPNPTIMPKLRIKTMLMNEQKTSLKRKTNFVCHAPTVLLNDIFFLFFFKGREGCGILDGLGVFGILGPQV
jgi:hypothetical protein